MDKNHLMPLWKYFNMSDEEKQEDLIYHGWRKIGDWLNQKLYNDYDYEFLDQYGLTDADINEIEQSIQYEDDTIIDEIINGRFKSLKALCFANKINYYTVLNYTRRRGFPLDKAIKRLQNSKRTYLAKSKSL